MASLSDVLLSLSLSEPELLSEPLWLLESSLDCSAASLLLLFERQKRETVLLRLYFEGHEAAFTLAMSSRLSLNGQRMLTLKQ